MPLRSALRACFLLLTLLALAAGRNTWAAVPTGFSQTRLVVGLSAPTAMEVVPDGRVLVAEQGGRLRVVKNGALLPTPFLQVTVDSNGERGLLGVTVAPDFPESPYVYVYYTVPGPNPHNRLSRFTANGDAAVPGSEEVLLELNPLSSAEVHNGGALHFGQDGMLYVAVGENGRAQNAQQTDNLLGKVLRLHRDGTIPEDNPFYNTASGNNRAIWVLGLRNPFTFAVERETGRLFINDVGQNAWEEINDGVRGANYGWPAVEGPGNNPGFRAPLYAYHHTAGDPTGCAIAGGDFYRPAMVQFPAQYVGKYFFSDYCAGWIRVLDPATGTSAPFAEGFTLPTDLRVGPDGSLYCLARKSGELFRIDYGPGTGPSITADPEDRTAAEGQAAVFTVSASGTAPLAYQWFRNNEPIPEANAAEYATPPVTFADNGARFRCRVSNASGEALSAEAVLAVTANTPPSARITALLPGAHYRGGDEIQFSGDGLDTEDGFLPAARFTWWVDFHHNDHTHPALLPTQGVTSGSFTVPPTGETSTNVWYRIHLLVTDSTGLAGETFVDVLPRIVVLSLVTDPPGLQLLLDGQPVTAPLSISSVTGITRTLAPVSPQERQGERYLFAGWSDALGTERTLSTPESDATYTATFHLAAPEAPTGLTATAVSSSRVQVAWTGAPGVQYELERRVNQRSFTRIAAPPAGTVEYQDGGRAANTRYSYRLRAVNSGGPSPYSAVVELRTPPAGKLSITPRQLNFGTVTVGQSSTRTVTLKNPGRYPVLVSLAQPGAPFSASPLGELRLAAGEIRTLSVSFSPSASGRFAADLVLTSDAAGARRVRVRLTGASRVSNSSR